LIRMGQKTSRKCLTSLKLLENLWTSNPQVAGSRLAGRATNSTIKSPRCVVPVPQRGAKTMRCVNSAPNGQSPIHRFPMVGHGPTQRGAIVSTKSSGSGCTNRVFHDNPA
jgi:hypothetical protein